MRDDIPDEDDDLDDLFGPPSVVVPAGVSLEDARAALQALADKGARCPCCRKWVKQYERPLNSTMVACLYWLVAQYEVQGSQGWVDVPDVGPLWLQKSKQHTILAWWGLVERAPNTGDPTRKHLGLWRPTSLGMKAARDLVGVPRSVTTLNGEVIGVSSEIVKVSAVRGVSFNYQDTMKPVFQPLTKTDRPKVTKLKVTKLKVAKLDVATEDELEGLRALLDA